MELMKMVVGQLWSAKREEEQAKALAKEDLAVANHRDASLLKSLQNSTHKIKKKHLGGQQPRREIVQAKAVAKAREVKIMELREETPCVPKRLGPLALLLALLTMSCLKSPSSTARIPTAQVLLASVRSNSTSGSGEVQEVGIAMDAACHGKDLGRWLTVEQSMDHMYLQVVPIKMKAKDPVER